MGKTGKWDQSNLGIVGSKGGGPDPQERSLRRSEGLGGPKVREVQRLRGPKTYRGGPDMGRSQYT